MWEAELESRKAGGWRKGRKLLIITYMLQEAIKTYEVWASVENLPQCANVSKVLRTSGTFLHCRRRCRISSSSAAIPWDRSQGGCGL